ncbi:TY-Chap domain-containing protein [Oryzobacter sp. R7]|uniref:TY-Chap domain-containing protein n=1 Tax=Oryzobacter faecalis TaxID=3388656 RepID=UPI00398C96AD
MSAADATRLGAGDWADWRERLLAALAGLTDGGSLTLTAPDAAVRPARLRRPRLRGLVPGRYEDVAPWVRLRRSEHHLRGFCIGSDVVGGTFPLSRQEHDALLGLGWRAPAPLEGHDYTHWWPDDVPLAPFLPEDEARRAVLMVEETFRTVLAAPSEDDRSPGLPTVTTG